VIFPVVGCEVSSRLITNHKFRETDAKYVITQELLDNVAIKVETCFYTGIDNSKNYLIICT
jgi:hypothetical protein